jgi:hypothetical protein
MPNPKLPGLLAFPPSVVVHGCAAPVDPTSTCSRIQRPTSKCCSSRVIALRVCCSGSRNAQVAEKQCKHPIPTGCSARLYFLRPRSRLPSSCGSYEHLFEDSTPDEQVLFESCDSAEGLLFGQSKCSSRGKAVQASYSDRLLSAALLPASSFAAAQLLWMLQTLVRASTTQRASAVRVV